MSGGCSITVGSARVGHLPDTGPPPLTATPLSCRSALVPTFSCSSGMCLSKCRRLMYVRIVCLQASQRQHTDRWRQQRQQQREAQVGGPVEEAATWRTHRAQGQVNALSMFCVAAALSNFSRSASPCRTLSPHKAHTHALSHNLLRLTSFYTNTAEISSYTVRRPLSPLL